MDSGSAQGLGQKTGQKEGQDREEKEAVQGWSLDMAWLLHHEFRATMATLTSPLWDQEN